MKKFLTPKQERIQQLKILLVQNPQGIQRAEIARQLGVNKSTITRYVREISHSTRILEGEKGRLCIDPHTFDHPIPFKPAEIQVLVSLLETAVGHSDFPNLDSDLGKDMLQKVREVHLQLST